MGGAGVRPGPAPAGRAAANGGPQVAWPRPAIAPPPGQVLLRCPPGQQRGRGGQQFPSHGLAPGACSGGLAGVTWSWAATSTRSVSWPAARRIAGSVPVELIRAATGVRSRRGILVAAPPGPRRRPAGPGPGQASRNSLSLRCGAVRGGAPASLARTQRQIASYPASARSASTRSRPRVRRAATFSASTSRGCRTRTASAACAQMTLRVPPVRPALLPAQLMSWQEPGGEHVHRGHPRPVGDGDTAQMDSPGGPGRPGWRRHAVRSRRPRPAARPGRTRR
jgi:hypothetical protein